MKHIRIALVLTLVPLALAVGAARASAQDITPNIPTTVPVASGVVPGQVAALAQKAGNDQALYGYLASYWYYDIATHSDAWLLALGTCEQGSDWSVHGPTFEGHFGMMSGLWDRVRRAEWPNNMGDASYDQQMAGVRAATALVGDGAWGCAGKAWGAVPSG